jgi:hypothetical protein
VVAGRTRFDGELRVKLPPLLRRQQGVEPFLHLALRSLEQLRQIRRVDAPSERKRIGNHMQSVERGAEGVCECGRVDFSGVGGLTEVCRHEDTLGSRHDRFSLIEGCTGLH